LITEEKILELVAEALTEDQFIVELRIDAANKIYIEVDDRVVPISITECIKVSRAVEHNLDREVEDFALEVASPGLDQPFKVYDQYVKNIGRPVKVKKSDGQIQKGTLVEVSPEEIRLEYKVKQKIEGRSKAKEWVTKSVSILMDDIKETYIEIVF